MHLINDSGGSPISLVFLIIQNSAYSPTLETLNTPGIKVVTGRQTLEGIVQSL
jgi:hypothetical protein